MTKRDRDDAPLDEQPNPTATVGTANLAGLLAKRASAAPRGRQFQQQSASSYTSLPSTVSFTTLPLLAKSYLSFLKGTQPDGADSDDEHGFVALNREIFTCIEWEQIRSDFFFIFNNHFQLGKNEDQNPALRKFSSSSSLSLSDSYKDQIREPQKFWRHCREQLAKWNLSQKAREPFISEEASRSSFFLPSASEQSDESSLTSTFDDQLVRDLTLKCRIASREREGTAEVPALNSDSEKRRNMDIANFIRLFRLDIRCSLAESRVRAAVDRLMKAGKAAAADTADASACTQFAAACAILNIEAAPSSATSGGEGTNGGDKVFTRVQGTEQLISPQWSCDVLRHTKDPHAMATSTIVGNGVRKLFKRFTIPEPAWEKLSVTYRGDVFKSPFLNDNSFMKETTVKRDQFLARAATLCIRYEINLSSGSLQLCADESLKRLFEEKEGYRVADFCASPINCWTHVDRDQESGKILKLHSPNIFCSAFYDTDRWFGSIGSALHVELKQFVQSFCSNGEQWILTLDVPYDEDLCEELFMKLSKDLEEETVKKWNSSSSPSSAATRCPVSFIGVLPLWWDLKFKYTDKVLACATEDSRSQKDGLSEGEQRKMMETVVAEGASYLKEGYVVDRKWTSTLTQSKWCNFDAVFVKDGYRYYCTSTNRLLEGVTSTEVLGFEHPQLNSGGEGETNTTANRKKPLSRILREYYHC